MVVGGGVHQFYWALNRSEEAYAELDTASLTSGRNDAWRFCFAIVHAQTPNPYVFDGRPLNPAAESSPYRAYAALTGRADDPGRVHMDLFVPLLSSRESLLFADVRGQYLYGGGGEGNLGLVHRHMFDDEYIAGV